MPRTRYLSGEELKRLRRSLREKFRTRNPLSRPVQATTYKEAYDDLRGDIISVVPEAEQSVSLTRLRKLFYYTDPEVCNVAQLENANFGKDFLSTLEVYLASSPGVTAILRTRKPGLRTIGLALAFVAGLILWIAFSSQAEHDRVEDFDDLHPGHLKQEGWEMLDFDSLYWHRQPRPGMLALYTLPGDYWVKPKEPRCITNLLTRPLKGGNIDITTRLIDFYPTQNHQQAGFILFNKDKSRVEHVRITYGYSGPFFNNQNPDQQNDFQGSHEICVVQTRKNGDVFQQRHFLGTVPATGHNAAMDTVYLLLSVRDNRCDVYYKCPFAWYQYNRAFSVELDFQPAYVGLAAFQGWTRDDGTPKGADTIPAFFDWVKVKSVK